MKKRWLPGTVSVTFVALSTLFAEGLFAAKPPREISLLVSFGAATSDTLRSDGLMAPGYDDDYANGLQNVLAILQTSGNFRFFTQNDTQQPALRSVCFDFGAQSVPFQRAQCVHASEPMHSYASGDVPIQNLRFGQSVPKLTRFAWEESGYVYRLGYGTDMNVDGIQDSPAVRVTCIAPNDTSQPCARWVVAPETDGTAALFRFALTTGKRAVVTEGPAEYVGTYKMPFTQTFTPKP